MKIKDRKERDTECVKCDDVYTKHPSWTMANLSVSIYTCTSLTTLLPQLLPTKCVKNEK